MNINTGGPGSVVSIATGYGLVQGSNLVAARFSAPVQTGPGAHPASCTMGTGFFPGGKERPRRDTDPSPLSSAVCHERVELYLYSPYGPYGLYKGALYLLYKHRHICVCSYMSFIIIYGNVTDGNFSN